MSAIKKLYLYIDANLYLEFYGFSDENLDELRKLIKLIEEDRLTLLLPEQTKDEVRRHRDDKVSDMLKTVSDVNVRKNFPKPLEGYGELVELKKIAVRYHKALKRLEDKVMHDFANRALGADILLSNLFDAATEVSTSKRLLKAARNRKTIGNPPGKGASHGDQINWEALLGHEYASNSKLAIVSDDGDYSSKIDRTRLHSMLQDEMKERHPTLEASLHSRLSSFVNANFDGIDFTEDMPKSFLIKDLAEANSFRLSKDILGNLEILQPFSSHELNMIAEAMTENNQIYHIRGDGIVVRFIRILHDKKTLLDLDVRKKLQRRYGSVTD